VVTAVAIRWNVSPAELAEVRRLSLYPFKPASTELDAEMTANPATIFGGAFREDQPIGCIAVLPEPNHECTARIRWFGVMESERGQGVGAQLVAAAQDTPLPPAKRSGPMFASKLSQSMTGSGLSRWGISLNCRKSVCTA
jgi:GNAT superfamily N-acetyltransferase